MTDERKQDRVPRQPARPKSQPDWEQDLDPHPPGEQIARESEARIQAEWNAFHLRKRGMDPGAVNEERERPKPSEG